MRIAILLGLLILLADLALAVQIKPYGDARTDQGSPNSNYELEQVLYVQRRTSNENRAYFAFNLSSISGSFNYANFSFYITGTANPANTFTDDFYFCNDTGTPGFNEMNLTWNTQDTAVDTCYSTPFFQKVRNTWTTSARYTLNITSFVNREQLLDKKFIIKIKVSSATDGTTRWLGLAAKDHATSSYHPYIEYESAPFVMQISSLALTSSDPDDTIEPYTSNDATPTFSFSTSINGNCSISNQNASYVPCATTGAMSHICTMPSNKTMTEGLNYTFIKCLGLDNVSKKYLTYTDTIDPVLSFFDPFEYSSTFVTANWTYTGNWLVGYPVSNMVDGNVSSLSRCTTTYDNCYLYMNDSINASIAFWTARTYTLTHNETIPSSCLNGDYLRRRVFSDGKGTEYAVRGYCFNWNTSSWTQVFSQVGTGTIGYAIFYDSNLTWVYPTQYTQIAFNRTINTTILEWYLINISVNDASGLLNASLFVNGTLNESIANPPTSALIGFNFTPGSFVNYSFTFSAFDNVSTYNEGSLGTLFYHFNLHFVGINKTYGENVSGLYFYPNLSNYNYSTDTITEFGTVPLNVTGSNPYIILCNNGTSTGNLRGKLNSSNPEYNIRCSTIFLLSSATNLTTNFTTLNSSIGGGKCNDVWCWLDWLNASSGWDFMDEWEII